MADSSYVIEVAAQVSGAAASTAELDSLSSSLSGSGVNAAHFDDAISRLTADLNVAKAATTAANAELGAGKSQYKQLEVAAEKAAKQVEKIESNLGTSKAAMAKAQGDLDAAVAAGAAPAKLARLEKQADKAAANLKKATKAAEGLGAAKAEAARAEAAAREYAGTLDDLSRKAKEAATSQAALDAKLAATSKLQKRVNDNLGDAATNLSTFRGALGDVGGPIAEFGERLLFPAQAFVDLREKFGSTTATAVVAGFGLARVGTVIASAFLKMAAAVGVAVAAIIGFSFAASNAARSLRLTREAAAIATPALAGLPFDEIANSTGIASTRLNELAKSLADAGVKAGDMPGALRAAATAEAALGAGGADKFVRDIKAGKKAVADLGAEVESTYGGIVARKMLGLEAQGQRMKANLAGLFAFEDIDGALEGLASLVALFDKTSVTGRVMRAAIKGIMDPVIDNAREAAFVVEAFAIGFATAAVRMYMSAKPAIDRVSELLGLDASEWSLEDVLDGAAKAGEYIAPVIGAIVAWFGILGVAAVAVVSAVLGVSVAMSELNAAIGRALAAVYEAVSGFVDAGVQIVAGLASGITSAAGQVIAAITGVVSGGISAAKSLLGIASPSKVFEDIGDNTAKGFAGGVDSGRDAAHTAIAAMTDPTVATGGSTSVTNSSSSSVSSSSRSSTTIVIERIELPNVADARSFLLYLEGLALQGAS